MSVRNNGLIIKGSLLMCIGSTTSLLNQDVVEVHHDVTLRRVDKLLMRLDSHWRVMLA